MKPITFKNQWDEEYKLIFCKDNYANNNRIYIGCMCEDEIYGGYEPYCNITVNLDCDMPDGNFGFLDVNNISLNLFDLMYKEGWIKDTGERGKSGFCVYPLVEFTDEFLEMIEKDNIKDMENDSHSR